MAKVQPTTAVIDWHTAKSAARVSGLTVDMVNYLCRHALVTPSGDKNRGYGVVRKYTYADVLLLRVVAKLLAQGISLTKLGKSLAALQRRGGRTRELVSKKYILTDGNNVYFQDSATLELLDSGQLAFAFVLELGSVRREIDDRILRRKSA